MKLIKIKCYTLIFAVGISKVNDVFRSNYFEYICLKLIFLRIEYYWYLINGYRPIFPEKVHFGSFC